MRYSDLVSYIRIAVSTIFALILCFYPTIFNIVLGITIIILIFISDGLDGYFARKYDGESKFGAFVDILGDRIAEIVLLIPFTYLNIANPIILTYFIVKGFLSDFNRFKKFSEKTEAPFRQVRSSLSKFLVSSRFMRGGYGIAKLLMVVFFYYSLQIQNINYIKMSNLFAFGVVGISLLRSLPVFFEKSK